MSQADREARRAARRGGTGAPPRRATRAPRARWPWIAAALLVAAAIAWGVRSRPRSVTGPATAAPIARLDVRAAYAEGARLFVAGRYLEAVPYFRQVAALRPDSPREFHMQITDALERATLQSRPDAPMPVTRSSAERVAMVREALAHLDAAERLSTTPRELAEVRAWRANIQRVWGFPWEALYSLRNAAAADSSWRVVAESADLFELRLRHPDRAIPGIDTDVILRDAP